MPDPFAAILQAIEDLKTQVNDLQTQVGDAVQTKADLTELKGLAEAYLVSPNEDDADEAQALKDFLSGE